MPNTIHLLRHGKTVVDPEAPIAEWVLSDLGRQQAEDLAQSKPFDQLDIIIVSGETKAFQTAIPFALDTDTPIRAYSSLNELHRPGSETMLFKDYEEAVEQALAHRSRSVMGWEKTGDALYRFRNKIAEIDRRYCDKRILFVGHAYTINLFFAFLLDKMIHIVQRHSKNKPCSWGTVQGMKVVKDICQE